MRFNRFVYKRLFYFLAALSFFLSICISCNKLVKVPNPNSSITAAETFSSDATATSAMVGIYSYMGNPNQPSFSNYTTSFYPGESADELTDEVTGNEMYDYFLSNKLTTAADAGTILGYFWTPAYYDIYCANAVISGLQSSTGVSPGTKNQLTGEAKFIRAFCYFYLTNLFGDIPLVLTTDFNQTVLLSKTPQAKIFQQIISDLQNAEGLMISDFSLTNGQPIRANKWAAAALLARVYLFQKNWVGADSAATAVINSGLFSLDSLNQIFLANSSESILQLQTPNSSPYSTAEGNFFNFNNLNAWITPQLINAIEPNDQRRLWWVDSTWGAPYYAPNKYRSSSYSASLNNVTENYTLLRLAEQFLIRAEADANGAGGGAGAAVTDLNVIRHRAWLPNLSDTIPGFSLMTAVQQEWRIEFFAEWGHRWFDLKRWGSALQTLGSIPYKLGNIDSSQLLYPLSSVELQTDPNLLQNPGYSSY